MKLLAATKVNSLLVRCACGVVIVCTLHVPLACATNSTAAKGQLFESHIVTDHYHLWAVDQSNTAPNQTALGVKGGFLWVYDSVDISEQILNRVDAKPLPCSPSATVGPCNVLDMFPSKLVDSQEGLTLDQLSGFGRLHGALPSHDGQYINANFVSTAQHNSIQFSSMSFHFMSCHVMSCHVMSCNDM
jgi:hypothetical protein